MCVWLLNKVNIHTVNTLLRQNIFEIWFFIECLRLAHIWCKYLVSICRKLFFEFKLIYLEFNRIRNAGREIRRKNVETEKAQILKYFTQLPCLPSTQKIYLPQTDWECNIYQQIQHFDVFYRTKWDLFQNFV